MKRGSWPGIGLVLGAAAGALWGLLGAGVEVVEPCGGNDGTHAALTAHEPQSQRR